MTPQDQLQETLCNRLFWHTAERDDAIVADHLFHCREMDVVYAMDEATLFDSFFNYLQEIDVFPLLEHLDPQKQRRQNMPFIQLVLVFLMKVVGSIKTIDEISDLLLTDELLMSMCGFNAHQVKKAAGTEEQNFAKPPYLKSEGLCVWIR
jgi:hypothetical protein